MSSESHVPTTVIDVHPTTVISIHPSSMHHHAAPRSPRSQRSPRSPAPRVSFNHRATSFMYTADEEVTMPPRVASNAVGGEASTASTDSSLTNSQAEREHGHDHTPESEKRHIESEIKALPPSSLEQMAGAGRVVPGVAPSAATPSSPVKQLKPHPSSVGIASTDGQGNTLIFMDSTLPSGSFRLQMSPLEPGDIEIGSQAFEQATNESAETRQKGLKNRSKSWRSLLHMHGPNFAFYSQFALVLGYYLVEYLTVLNILNRPQFYISGVPLLVLVLSILNMYAFRAMRRLQILTVVVETLCFAGLMVYDEITPSNMDDRHRTEYYDMHAHAAALNFILVVFYASVWSSGNRDLIREERLTQAVLTHRLPHKHSDTLSV